LLTIYLFPDPADPSPAWADEPDHVQRIAPYVRVTPDLRAAPGRGHSGGTAGGTRFGPALGGRGTS
jgi:hypothetical protein